MKSLDRRTATGAVGRLWGVRVMNEPIISPWLIYWAGRLDMIYRFCIVAGFLLTMGASISVIVFVANIFDCGGSLGKAFLSFTKKLTCVALIVDALAMVVPTKDEMIAMYVARYITPANIEATGELADKAVDKLIEKVLKASEATKKE